jgi:hypothetical protein
VKEKNVKRKQEMRLKGGLFTEGYEHVKSIKKAFEDKALKFIWMES